MRHDPPLPQAWRLFRAIITLGCLALLVGSTHSIVSQPHYPYPTSVYQVMNPCALLFESLVVLIVLITRRWRWMPLAILLSCIGPPLNLWLSAVQHSSLPKVMGPAMFALQTAAEIGLVATAAWLWRDLNRAVMTSPKAAAPRAAAML